MHKIDLSFHIFIKIFGNIFLCIILCQITNDLSKYVKSVAESLLSSHAF